MLSFEIERADFSDFMLLKNMLTSVPERVKLTLVSRAEDLPVSTVFSENVQRQLATAAKDLIVNSYVNELDQKLPAMPKIIVGDVDFYFYTFEITNYYYDKEEGKMMLDAYLIFKTIREEIRDSPNR